MALILSLKNDNIVFIDELPYVFRCKNSVYLKDLLTDKEYSLSSEFESIMPEVQAKAVRNTERKYSVYFSAPMSVKIKREATNK